MMCAGPARRVNVGMGTSKWWLGRPIILIFCVGVNNRDIAPTGKVTSSHVMFRQIPSLAAVCADMAPQIPCQENCEQSLSSAHEGSVLGTKDLG